MMNAKTYTSQNNYDDFYDNNVEMPLFCGLDYDEFDKISYVKMFLLFLNN